VTPAEEFRWNERISYARQKGDEVLVQELAKQYREIQARESAEATARHERRQRLKGQVKARMTAEQYNDWADRINRAREAGHHELAEGYLDEYRKAAKADAEARAEEKAAEEKAAKERLAAQQDAHLEAMRVAVRNGVSEEALNSMRSTAVALGMGVAADWVVNEEKDKQAARLAAMGGPVMPEYAHMFREAAESALKIQLAPVAEASPIKKAKKPKEKEKMRVHWICEDLEENFTICGEVMSQEALDDADRHEELEESDVNCQRCKWIYEGRLKWQCPCGHEEGVDFHKDEDLLILHGELE